MGRRSGEANMTAMLEPRSVRCEAGGGFVWPSSEVNDHRTMNGSSGRNGRIAIFAADDWPSGNA